jgi:hypothetical protein
LGRRDSRESALGKSAVSERDRCTEYARSLMSWWLAVVRVH